MEELGPKGRIFMKFHVPAFLTKSIEKIQATLKSDKKRLLYMETNKVNFNLEQATKAQMRCGCIALLFL
jgi:hypothetical protein